MDIIVDIDGTIADCTHRLHYIQKTPKDWDSFFAATNDDAAILPMVVLIGSLVYNNYHRVAYVSGRPEKTRIVTMRWLSEHALWGPRVTGLWMRRDDDRRDDHILKKEILGTLRDEGFEPKLAFEDRKRIVDMWRAEGLICAHVAEGEF